VLWYRGELAALRGPAVAIVGSRAASVAALEIAGKLAEDLAARGAVIVSGLARGVDSAAHEGALRAGRTMAVLGSGVDRLYPREHDGLAHRIAEHGLVLSEYPPGTPPLAFHFPMRNRLISGLSRGVIVVEASEQSGSLITAACALQQGREVMAVPGNVLGGRNRGAHALIRDGATIVESAADVLETLGWGTQRQWVTASSEHAVEVPRDPLLAVMRPGESYDLDHLSACTHSSGADLLARLLTLELEGSVRRTAAGGFMRPLRTC
jgi:DNA processing protein